MKLRIAIVLSILLLLTAGVLFAAEGYRTGLNKAKAENKHVLLYFFSKY